MSRNLKIVLKRKWWELIASGIKKEEYRDFTEYWFKHIMAKGSFIPSYQAYCYQMDRRKKGPYSETYKGKNDIVTFYLGYAQDRPSMSFKIDAIVLGNMGLPEWGAPEKGEYFIIKLGERLK